MVTNPLDTLDNYAPRLISYGLVKRVAEGGTGGYKVTGDGILYIDGMLCAQRDCAEHPRPYDDLKAVSRGRYMDLNGDELVALAVIFLGDQLTNRIVRSGVEQKCEELIDGALLNLSGLLSHGLRHANAKGNGADAFNKQYAVGKQSYHVDILKILEAALKSWPLSISKTIEALMVGPEMVDTQIGRATPSTGKSGRGGFLQGLFGKK